MNLPRNFSYHFPKSSAERSETVDQVHTKRFSKLKGHCHGMFTVSSLHSAVLEWNLKFFKIFFDFKFSFCLKKFIFVFIFSEKFFGEMPLKCSKKCTKALRVAREPIRKLLSEWNSSFVEKLKVTI